MKLVAPLVSGLVLLVVAGTARVDAQPLPPTDLVAVDEYIDAPLALFGRTRPAVERTLGAPAAIRPRTLPGGRRAATDAVDELAYPGVVIGVSRRSAAVRRVEITEPRWALPRGLTIGVSRSLVEHVLGEPQAATDVSILYLYSDAYPETVEFYLRGDRVRRIEWLYAPAD
jgi:hypothetical protein